MFKAETGISFVDYISLVKMARAKLLFLEGRWKVFEISSMLGFSETGYFCKIFKKTQGITPNQYKAKLKLSGPYSNPGENCQGIFGPQLRPKANDQTDITAHMLTHVWKTT
jgi:AraC-like DNA-binding protein